MIVLKPMMPTMSVKRQSGSSKTAAKKGGFYWPIRFQQDYQIVEKLTAQREI